MIIWSRWGIVVLLFFGAGVGLGFLLMALLGIRESGGAVPGVFVGIGFILSGIGLYFFNRFVVGRHIDKPRLAVVYEKLPEPVRADNGAVQTHRAIPVVHPETGQQLVTQPTSTFFFVPIKYWVYVLPALGLLVLVVNLVGVLTS